MSLGRDRVIGVVRRQSQGRHQIVRSMSIEVSIHRWQTDTRPCDFSLYLETVRGAVFADFDSHGGTCVTLRRVSFDGYGCCRTENGCSKMNSDDSIVLVEAIREDDVNNDIVRGILLRYFAENSDTIWRDALEDHQLLNT